MAKMGTDLDPESKIWKLSRLGVLVFGSGFGFEVNFSDSAHLCGECHIYAL